MKVWFFDTLGDGSFSGLDFEPAGGWAGPAATQKTCLLFFVACKNNYFWTSLPRTHNVLPNASKLNKNNVCFMPAVFFPDMLSGSRFQLLLLTLGKQLWKKNILRRVTLLVLQMCFFPTWGVSQVAFSDLRYFQGWSFSHGHGHSHAHGHGHGQWP